VQAVAKGTSQPAYAIVDGTLILILEDLAARRRRGANGASGSVYSARGWK
jgi:hypothetical protein